MLRIFLLVLLLHQITPAIAATNAHYRLSSQARLEWGRSIEMEPNPLLMHQGTWFEGDWAGKPFSVWVSRSEGKATDLEKARAEWTETVARAMRDGKKVVDRGCELKQKVIVCEKIESESVQKGRQLNENHTLSRSIWNNGKDLIYVRFHAYQQYQLLNELKSNINVVLGDQ